MRFRALKFKNISKKTINLFIKERFDYKHNAKY